MWTKYPRGVLSSTSLRWPCSKAWTGADLFLVILLGVPMRLGPSGRSEWMSPLRSPVSLRAPDQPSVSPQQSRQDRLSLWVTFNLESAQISHVGQWGNAADVYNDRACGGRCGKLGLRQGLSSLCRNLGGLNTPTVVVNELYGVGISRFLLDGNISPAE